MICFLTNNMSLKLKVLRKPVPKIPDIIYTCFPGISIILSLKSLFYFNIMPGSVWIEKRGSIGERIGEALCICNLFNLKYRP